MLAPLYLDYIYNTLGAELYKQVMEIPPGEIVLRNTPTLNLFNHPHVVLWHKFLLEIYSAKSIDGDYALILPCSSVKPYRISATHRLADAIIRRKGLDNDVQIYVLSEPMILVPRELDIYYPFANYDYPPRELEKRYRDRFIDILAKILPKLDRYRRIVAVLPKHHRTILLDAIAKCQKCIDLIMISYGKRAFESIKYGIEILKT